MKTLETFVRNGQSAQAAADDLLPERQLRAGSEAIDLRQLPVSRIEPSPTNPRKRFDQVELDELADSLKSHGVLQPLLVRPYAGGKFQIVAGERRWRAAVQAGLAEVPAIVRVLTEGEILEIQYIENLQRQDLSAIEEAEGFQKLISTGRYSAESLAAKLKKSRSHVFSRLRLVKLNGAARAALDGGKINASIAGLIAQIPDPNRQKEALKKVWRRRRRNRQACHGGFQGEEGREKKGSRLHAKWGYQLDQVKEVRCLLCKRKIGSSDFVEIPILARFGTMLFAHRACDNK